MANNTAKLRELDEGKARAEQYIERLKYSTDPIDIVGTERLVEELKTIRDASGAHMELISVIKTTY